MIILNGTNKIKILSQIKSTVVTIGNFDGVHIGHQKLLSKTVQISKNTKKTSVAITFKPHPTRIIENKKPAKLITPYSQRNKLIEKIGIDLLLCIPFTKEIAEMPAIKFIEDILIKQTKMKIIIIGKDYRFGKNRNGNAEILKKHSNELDFKVIIIEWIRPTGKSSKRVSSTIIRNAIMQGEISTVTKMLNRNHSIEGKVIHGKNIGKKIGFPTANIVSNNSLYPKNGVYIVRIKHKNQFYNGVTNIGSNPTFNNKKIQLETHIFNFNDDMYNENIEIQFIERLRNEKKFPNPQELVQQIKKDIEQAKQYIKNNQTK